MLAWEQFSLHLSGRGPVLHDITLKIHPGDVVVVSGPSGAGKSLWMATALGLFPSQATLTGDIRWNGQSLLAPRTLASLRGRVIRWIPQGADQLLPPHRSPARFLMDFALSFGIPGAKRLEAVRDALIAAGLESSHWHKASAELSGGMRQRTLLALMWLGAPSLILMDEPVKGLDEARVHWVIEQLKALCGARPDLSVVMVTHQPISVPRARHLVMEQGSLMDETSLREPIRHGR